MKNVLIYKSLRATLFCNSILDCVVGIYIYFQPIEVFDNIWEYQRDDKKSIDYFDTPQWYMDSEDYEISATKELINIMGIYIRDIYLN